MEAAARLLLLGLLPLAIGLPMENPRESINFANGFPGNFADGLPTDEFTGVLPGLSRSKRQLENIGVSQQIAEMLAAPYQGPTPSDITSLLQRNSLVRPVRQSHSSDSSRRFPQAFTPNPTRFFDNFVEQPARPPVRKQPTRQPVQPTVRQPVRNHGPQPTRQSSQQNPRTTQRRPQQNSPPKSQFPSFSEAQAEHKRTNEENINHFTNDGFFESSRIRNRRDVTSRQAPAAEGREDKDSHKGFMPNNFPSFQSIGGFEKMPDEPDQSSNSFVPVFNPPQIDIPDIQEDQPKFSIPSHFAQQVSSPQQGKPKRETQSQHQNHHFSSPQQGKPKRETQSQHQTHHFSSPQQGKPYRETQSQHQTHHFKIKDEPHQPHQQHPTPHRDQTQLQRPQNIVVHTENPLETHPDEEFTLLSPTPDLNKFPNLNAVTYNPKFQQRVRPKRRKNPLSFLNPFNILGSSRQRIDKVY